MAHKFGIEQNKAGEYVPSSTIMANHLLERRLFVEGQRAERDRFDQRNGPEAPVDG